MKKYLVIFFAIVRLALPAFSQQELSYEQLQKVKEVIKASPQMEFTEGYTTKLNINSVSDDHWRMIILNGNYAQQQQLAGTFELIDLANATSVKVWDTTLTVSVSDLSLAWETREGTPVEDPRFRIPTYEVGTKKIINSYVPLGKEQDVLADANTSLDEPSVEPSIDVNTTELADVEWVKKDSSFITTMNGKDYFFQIDSAGKWASNDPDAPKVIKAGDRKGDPVFVFNKNGDLVASNKRNAYKFGMGDYAGYSNNYYRNAMNGRPLGGGYGLMPVASTFYPSYSYGFPMMGGGGWGAGFGGGCYGGGFSAGFSLDFGWTSGCSYANPYYMMPNRYSSGGAAIWNGYTHVGIDWIGSGVGWSAGGSNGYWYDDGCGGYKSNQVASADTYVSETNDSYYTETSGGAKSLPVAEQQEEVFTSVGVSKFLANEDVVKTAPVRENSQLKTAPVATENRMSDIPATRSTQREVSSRTTDRTEARAEVNNRFQDLAPTRKAPAPAVVSGEKPRNSRNSGVTSLQDVKPGRHNPAISQDGRGGNTARDTRNTSARAQQDPKPLRTRNTSVTPSTNHRSVAPPTTRRSNPAPHVGQKPANNGGSRTVRNSGGQNRGSVTRPVRTQRANPSATTKPMRSNPPMRQAKPQMRQQPMRSAPAPRVRKGR